MLKKILKNYCIVFFLLFLHQQIFTSNHQTTDKQAKNIIFSNQPHSQKKEYLRAFLTKYPAYVSTNKPGLAFFYGQTIAHLLANQSDFDSLNMMVDDFQESATAQLWQQDTPKTQNRYLGATPFLILCFKAKEYLECSIVKKLLQKNPTLAITSRSDGMSPALACAGFPVTNIKLYILKILLNFHPDAYKKSTANGESIAELLLKNSKCSNLSKNIIADTLVHILTKEPALIKEKLLFCCAIGGNSECLPVLAGYIKNISDHIPEMRSLCLQNFRLNIKIKNQFLATLQGFSISPQISNPVLTSGRFDDSGQCLCCLEKCYCCENESGIHWEIWKKRYEQAIQQARRQQARFPQPPSCYFMTNA